MSIIPSADDLRAVIREADAAMMELETGKRESHVKYGKSGGAYADMADAVESELGRIRAKSENTVTFRYRIHQEVTLKDLQLRGRVMARMDRGRDFTEYRVIWWADAKRYDQWICEHELEES